MLLNLNISNLATIQKLDVEFKEGFTILTGETGAGKSIIIDAIQLVLGRKSDVTLIRSGETSASVEAVFDISQLVNLKQLLDETGL